MHSPNNTFDMKYFLVWCINNVLWSLLCQLHFYIIYILDLQYVEQKYLKEAHFDFAIVIIILTHTAVESVTTNNRLSKANDNKNTWIKYNITE